MSTTTDDITALNAYRLTSLEEPTDEMLSAIMREAAEEACVTNEKASAQLFMELDKEIAKSLQNWGKYIANR